MGSWLLSEIVHCVIVALYVNVNLTPFSLDGRRIGSLIAAGDLGGLG
jgi:hypothetical protein